MIRLLSYLSLAGSAFEPAHLSLPIREQPAIARLAALDPSPVSHTISAFLGRREIVWQICNHISDFGGLDILHELGPRRTLDRLVAVSAEKLDGWMQSCLINCGRGFRLNSDAARAVAEIQISFRSVLREYRRLRISSPPFLSTFGCCTICCATFWSLLFWLFNRRVGPGVFALPNTTAFRKLE